MGLRRKTCNLAHDPLRLVGIVSILSRCGIIPSPENFDDLIQCLPKLGFAAVNSLG